MSLIVGGDECRPRPPRARRPRPACGANAPIDRALVVLVGRQNRSFVPFLSVPVDHAHEHDDAAVGVVPAVEDQRRQRRVADRPSGGGMRSTTASSISWMPMPVFADDQAARPRRRGRSSSSICCLTQSGRATGRSILLSTGTIVEVVVEREVDVGERLRLDALRRIDDEQRALAGGERARHLVVEVDVARACRSG